MPYCNPRGLQPRKETCSPAAQRLLHRGSTEVGRDVQTPRQAQEVPAGWAQGAVGPALVSCSHGVGPRHSRDSTQRAAPTSRRLEPRQRRAIACQTAPYRCGHRRRLASLQHVCARARQRQEESSPFHYQTQPGKYREGSCSRALLPTAFEPGSGKMPPRDSKPYITESLNVRGWKGPLWVIQSNPPAEAGSPTAGCTGPCPGGS